MNCIKSTAHSESERGSLVDNRLISSAINISYCNIRRAHWETQRGREGEGAVEGRKERREGGKEGKNEGFREGGREGEGE